MKYDAFITYSHAEDRQFARRLHAALHGFAKSWYRLRAVRIYRDETGLTAAATLPASIESALLSSKYLLLLASPEAAGSIWVSREVSFWLKNRPAERIVIALTRGRLEWDDATGDFTRVSDAVPEPLRGKLTAEPLWIDFRHVKRDRDFTKKHPDFLGGLATLSATLRGEPKDDLIGEDVRQYRLVRRIAAVGVTTLVLLLLAAVGFAIMAVDQRKIADREAENARTEARISKSRELAAHSRYLKTTKPDLALLLAVEATRFEETPQARDSLLAALLERPEAVGFLRFKGEKAKVLALDRDGRTLATGHEQGAILIWDVASRKPVMEIRRKDTTGVCDLEFRQTDHALVYLLCDGTLGLLPSDSTQPLWESGVPSTAGAVENVAIHPEGTQLATGGDSLYLWDSTTGRIVGDSLVKEDPDFYSLDLVFSPDGRALAVANPGEAPHGAVLLWDLQTRSRTRKFTRSFPRGARIRLAFADNSSLAVSSANGFFRWNTKDGALESSWYPNAGEGEASLPMGFLTAIASSGDGSLVATTSFSVPSSLILLRFAKGVPQDSRLDGHTKPILDIAVAPDGQLAVSISEDTAILWNLSGEPGLGTLASRYRLSDEPVTSVALHSETGTLAVGRADGTAVLSSRFDAGTVTTSTIMLGPSAVTSLAFDPTGALLGAGLADGGVLVWERTRRRILFRYTDHKDVVTALAFSPDSRLLASGSKDMDTRLRPVAEDSGTGTVLARGSNRAWINALAFSPDGRILASALAISLDQVDLWDVATRSRLTQPLGIPGGSATAVAFSPQPSADILAVSSDSGTVRTWDITDLVAPIPGLETPPTNPITTLTFDAAAAFIATGHRNGDVRLWDTASGQLVGAPIPGSARPVGAVAMMERDGRRSLAIAKGGEVTLWKFDTASWVAEACALVNRRLTKTERLRYIGAGRAYKPGCDTDIGWTYAFTIETDPADAEVHFKDVDLLYYPGVHLPAGRYRIRVAKPGYETYEGAVGILAADRTLRVTLDPLVARSQAGDALLPEMVSIEGGCLEMFTAGEVCVEDFELGRYEVTFEEYDRFAIADGRRRPDDQGWGRGNRPVINVTWYEATAYADWLSSQTGRAYRLPTEAEWAHAAWTGARTSLWGVNPDAACQFANVYDQSAARETKFPWSPVECDDGYASTAPVDSFPPDGNGIHSILGNVDEWTCSRYVARADERIVSTCAQGVEEDAIRTIRKGSWRSQTSPVHKAIKWRWTGDAVARYDWVGFRLVEDKDRKAFEQASGPGENMCVANCQSRGD